MNGLPKCPKFEKKFERKRTAIFWICPSNVSHKLGRKNQMTREISSHCDKNSSHNIGANTDEYNLCFWYDLTFLVFYIHQVLGLCSLDLCAFLKPKYFVHTVYTDIVNPSIVHKFVTICINDLTCVFLLCGEFFLGPKKCTKQGLGVNSKIVLSFWSLVTNKYKCNTFWTALFKPNWHNLDSTKILITWTFSTAVLSVEKKSSFNVAICYLVNDFM